MSVWIIEPRDPVIFRDGRPFQAVPGARAVSLRFPFPSTTTGALRTREGLDEEGRFQEKLVEHVKGIDVKGPLLVELDAKTGEISKWLVPAPSDALLIDCEPQNDSKGHVKRLVPLKTNPGDCSDLPKGLSLVGPIRPVFRKPCSNSPRFWYWGFFERWLLAPKEQDVLLSCLGYSGPVRETRMHVGIDPKTMAANTSEGTLFQTQGLEFTQSSDGGCLSETRRLALAVKSDASNITQGFGPLGGEGRLAIWRKSRLSLPNCPSSLKEKVSEHRACRVILLTPAYFEKGWKPTWLLSSNKNVNVSLKAVVVNRPVVASGWDLAKGGAKPTRRLAPAGTTLFLRLDGSNEEISKWVDSIWMRCVSDYKQDRLDGFGLAVIGTWDGILRLMEV